MNASGATRKSIRPNAWSCCAPELEDGAVALLVCAEVADGVNEDELVLVPFKRIALRYRRYAICPQISGTATREGRERTSNPARVSFPFSLLLITPTAPWPHAPGEAS